VAVGELNGRGVGRHVRMVAARRPAGIGGSADRLRERRAVAAAAVRAERRHAEGRAAARIAGAQ
jgi:hypothetical protein